MIATFGDDAVVQVGNGFGVYSALDGSLEWMSPVYPSAATSTASVLAIAANFDNTIHRFAAGGTELLPAWTAPASGVAAMAFDPAGDLVVTSEASATTSSTLFELSPTGTQIFSRQLGNDPNTGMVLGGGPMLVLPSGQIAALREHTAAEPQVGSAFDEVEVYDATGTLTWGFQLGTGWTANYPFEFGFTGQLVAAPAGGFRVVGDYGGSYIVESFMP